MLLDQVRRALADGNARGALSLLERHAHDFPSPQLGHEARVLRIESLVRAGDCATATELGQRTLGTSPTGPLGRRIHAAMAACSGTSSR